MARHQLIGRQRQPLPGARSVGAADPMERFEVSVLVRGRHSDFAAITDFATGHGLALIQKGGARLTVILSGTVAQFNDAFGVKLESGPPQLIEMAAGLLVASWDPVTSSVEPMLPWRKDNHRVMTAAASCHDYRIGHAAKGIAPITSQKSSLQFVARPLKAE
jgi:hypothetical protein